METLLRQRRKALRSQRYNEAWRKLREAVDYLNREGAEEIYLFGSITTPEKFTERSDIDLAVRGIAVEKRLEIEGKLEDILGDLEYDILFLEEEEYLRKEILNRIREEAVLWKPSS